MGRIKLQRVKPLPKPHVSQPPETEPPATPSPETGASVPRARLQRWLFVIVAMVALTGSASAWIALRDGARASPTASPSSSPPTTVAHLLALSANDLSSLDLARMNLVCAAGLRGSETLDVEASLRQLNMWAARVATETERYWYQFVEKPEDFNHSEGYFRMLMMITVLQQDLGVHYNLERVDSPDFSNAQDVFISGMIGSTNGGTCSSMPMLYTAVARRLGYPVFIVKAKEHLFCRWDGAWGGTVDRFNIEGAGRGMNSFPDEHYHTWPHPITSEEIQRGFYLRSLNPSETLAMCLAARAYVLEDNGDISAACVMYAEAAKRDTRDQGYPLLASRALRHSKSKVARLPFIPPPDGEPQDLMDFNRRNMERATKNFFPDRPQVPGQILTTDKAAPQPYQPPVPGLDR
jgi:hypothetical protein